MTTATPVRDAATVVLLRDGTDGIEAWLLTRVRQMVFAAGMSVFPGGRVDESDAQVPLYGADVEGVARRFGCTESLAHMLLAAAVREIFEETGVLVTVPPSDLSSSRADVEGGRVPFAELLRSRDLAVDASGLRPWSRWVTPAGEVRRYDTRFFVAALPDGVDASQVTTEASSAQWLPIGVALEQAQRGERGLLPPTLFTLVSLQDFATVAEALEESDSRLLDPVRPEIQIADDGSVTAQLPDGTVAAIPRDLVQ